jgi:hypothetical protein
MKNESEVNGIAKCMLAYWRFQADIGYTSSGQISEDLAILRGHTLHG